MGVGELGSLSLSSNKGGIRGRTSHNSKAKIRARQDIVDGRINSIVGAIRATQVLELVQS